MNNFQKALKFVLDKEGGYVNDPQDPGGETKYGISKRAFPKLDIKNLTLQQASDIYYKEYWFQYKLDDMAFPLCIACMDALVQHNPSKVLDWVKKSDGDIRTFLELRRNYYLMLIEKKPSLKKFKNGWMNRLNDLRKYIDILVASQSQDH